jgi:hypothetical protein
MFDSHMTQSQKQPTPDTRSLPANRSFVVQFRAVTVENKDVYQGRIEHLASGKAENFSSEQELHDIVKRLLPQEGH